MKHRMTVIHVSLGKLTGSTIGTAGRVRLRRSIGDEMATIWALLNIRTEVPEIRGEVAAIVFT
jgi:hypothetical protein